MPTKVIHVPKYHVHAYDVKAHNRTMIVVVCCFEGRLALIRGSLNV
jgi:hypothetical protein